MFDVAIWGTVGQWVAAVVTTLALTTTFYVIMRDHRLRKRTQARKVAFYFKVTHRTEQEDQSDDSYWYDFVVKNISDEPIYDISILLSQENALDLLNFEAVLLPEEQLRGRLGAKPSQTQAITMFRDNGGVMRKKSILGYLTQQRRFNIAFVLKLVASGRFPFDVLNLSVKLASAVSKRR